jgi:hypothetical protein
MPSDARLIIDRTWVGAAISGQAINARWGFLRRTVEVEEKVALLHQSEHGPVRLMLCSDGFAWRKDALEDFADYYRTVQFREDDWAPNAIPRFLADEGITLARTLAGICYLERRTTEAKARLVAMDLRGPAFGA